MKKIFRLFFAAAACVALVMAGSEAHSISDQLWINTTGLCIFAASVFIVAQLSD